MEDIFSQDVSDCPILKAPRDISFLIKYVSTTARWGILAGPIRSTNLVNAAIRIMHIGQEVFQFLDFAVDIHALVKGVVSSRDQRVGLLDVPSHSRLLATDLEPRIVISTGGPTS